MNRGHLVIWLAAIVLGAVLLYPPWENLIGRPNMYAFDGHDWLFRGPELGRIDVARLAIYVALVGCASIVAVLWPLGKIWLSSAVPSPLDPSRHSTKQHPAPPA